MSAIPNGTQNQSLEFINKLPAGRMALIGAGLLLMIVVTIAVLRISQSPSKQMLFTKLDAAEVPLILEVLESKSVDYELQGQDTILIDAKQIGSMKMELATQGLPRGGARGYDVVSQSNDVYGKTEMEQFVLYKQALEEEIQDAIKTLDAVKLAKVLLAIPKSSRLLKNKGKVSASITVITWNGAKLTRDQVNGIVKIVTDSVPELHEQNVSLVDQSGKQLNVIEDEGGVSSRQLDYVRQIEKNKSAKVLEMVEPFVGVGDVKVAITADVDFSHREVRRDDFDSGKPSIRSQQLVSNSVANAAGGIPGSASNQPPSAGMAPETYTGNAGQVAPSGNSESITNYEVDKSSFYEVNSKGALTKLAVSVVVNKKVVPDGEGGVLYQDRTLDEMKRIEQLVQAAVGFDEERGDKIFVSSEEFAEEDMKVIISDQSPRLWEQAWLGDAINQVLGLLFILIVFFGILRPILKNTSRNMDIERAHQIALAQEREKAEAAARRRAKELREADTPEEQFRQHQAEVNRIISEDSKAVNQILKHWMARD